jgi:hypothetical protein
MAFTAKTVPRILNDSKVILCCDVIFNKRRLKYWNNLRGECFIKMVVLCLL